MLFSPRVRLILSLVAAFFLVFVVLRGAFFWFFLSGLELPSQELWHAFGIGVRFDLRLALLIVLPVAILSLLPGLLGLRRGQLARKLAVAWLALASAVACFVYIADFAHYSYLEERLNSSVLRFLTNRGDSLQMVWESYPVVWLTLLLMVTLAVGAWLGRKPIAAFARRPAPGRGWLGGTIAVALGIYLYALGIMGQTGTVPLRWSDAYFSNNLQVASLGLNPAIFFYDTYTTGTREHDDELLALRYQRVAEYLGVTNPDPETMTFARSVPGQAPQRPPNVVLIHLESMGANRMGLFGNPMEATPNLDRLGSEGLFFPNFMVPSSGTARTVFGLVTGIPDITWGGSTASRDPQIVNQYTLVNAFKDYERLYFIGGSAGWANIRGVLKNNIQDLELWEAGDYDAPNIDVWGISDRDLFKAAHQRLDQLDPDKPFIAFIQTAGNHRPFTIPDDDSDFEVINPPEDKVRQHGFLGNDQYNAVRLLDYNIGYYLNDLVANSHYADNTIFILYGDHNDRSEPSQHMGYSESLLLDKHHVPLIIYGPNVIGGHRVIERPASLVDIMPMALGLAGLPYENRTMGRDLLHIDGPSYAITFGGDRSHRPLIGLVGEDYHLSMYYDGDNARLYDLEDPRLEADVRSDHPEVFQDRKELLEGLYQAGRYMLHHNRP